MRKCDLLQGFTAQSKNNLTNIGFPHLLMQKHSFLLTDVLSQLQYVSIVFHRSFTCLQDDPHERDWGPTPVYPGVTYSLDDQCRFDFGQGYKRCTAVSMLLSRIKVA